MRFIKQLGIVFGVIFVLLVFHKPLLYYACRFVSVVDGSLHRRGTVVGHIKSALGQSGRLAAALSRSWGYDKPRLQQVICDFLWDDKEVVIVEVRNIKGELMEFVAFKDEKYSIPLSSMSDQTDAPVLFARDGKRLDVHRIIYVGSNVVGLLSMQRQTTIQLTPKDIADFLQYGDGGNL